MFLLLSMTIAQFTRILHYYQHIIDSGGQKIVYVYNVRRST